MALSTTTVARQSTTADATNTNNTTVPAPNASSATNVDPNSVFTGLCDILNAWQQQLVKDNVQKYADVYEIKFSPEALMNLKLKKPGTVDQTQTNMQNPDSSKKLDPETNKVNNNSQTIQITAGKQISKVIDEIMRQSEYVYEQQIVTVDPTTGKQVPNPNSAGGQTAWFNIIPQVTIIGNSIDTERNVYPVKITYIVSPYSLATVPSEYFNNNQFRGVHKRFNYWFTGDNTQILYYEQTYNMLYNLTISSQDGVPGGNKYNIADSRELYTRMFATRSEQSDLGSSSNEAGANLADGLFNTNDFISVGLRIVGDPAWLQQGPGVSGGSVNFDAFNPDGTINFNAGQVLFDVSWNRPVDYDFQTGIMPVTAKNVTGTGGGLTLPQENQTYIALEVKSMFSKGRFEQELIGQLLVGIGNGGPTAESAAPKSAPATVSQAAAPNVTAPQVNLANTSLMTDGTSRKPTAREQLNDLLPGKNSPANPNTSSPSTTNQNTPVTPANPPRNPTSTGAINTSFDTTVPPVLGQLTLNNGRVATFYDTTDPFVSQNRADYEKSLASGATIVAPQLIKKDDA
jgi:hypothetical protein